MKLIKDRVPEVGVVDTFFVAALESGRDGQQFLSQNMMTMHEKVLIPVHKDNHWSLVVGNM